MKSGGAPLCRGFPLDETSSLNCGQSLPSPPPWPQPSERSVSEMNVIELDNYVQRSYTNG